MELGYKEAMLRQESLINSLKKAGDDLRELIGAEEGTPINIGIGVPAVADDLLVLEGRVNNFIASIDSASLKVASKQARLDQELKRLRKAEVNQRPKLNGLVTVRRDSDNVDHRGQKKFGIYGELRGF